MYHRFCGIKIVIRRAASAALAAAILAASFPAGGPAGAYAAQPPAQVRNFVERTGNTATGLRVEWINMSLAGVKTARAVWVDNLSAGPAQNEWVLNAKPMFDAAGAETGDYEDIAPVVIPVRKCGLKYDVLYQIKIELYDTVDAASKGPPAGAAPVLSVETAYLPGITVGFEHVVNERYRELKPGEKETGYNPALACSFKTPSVYVNADADGGSYALSANGKFLPVFGGDPADPSNRGYKAALKAVQKLRPGITDLKMVLGLENYTVLTNTYTPLNEILFDWDAGSHVYICTVNFGGGVKYTVIPAYNGDAGNSAGANTDGWYRIYLFGNTDMDAGLPDDPAWAGIMNNQSLMDEIIPPEALGQDGFSSVLRYKYVYPGSPYRLHAEIKYMAGGSEVQEIPGSGFEVVGERPSRDDYTSLRMVVSKISDEYVRADIFRINNGFDFVVDNGYKIAVTPETSSSFGPEMEVTVNDFPEAPKNLQAYIKVTNPTVRYFFQAMYVRSNGSSGPSSARIPYALQTAGENVPVIPKGLAIEKIEYDPVRKITDVTVSWDRPANWQTATSNDIYLEFELNTSHRDLEKASELRDGEGGGPYGEFVPLYRTVLAVRREMVSEPSANRLSYKISGDGLFNLVYGTPAGGFQPPAPFIPETLYNGAFWDGERDKGRPSGQILQYPDHLLPNTRYFITLRSVLWLSEAGAPVKYESNASPPAAFTTYPTHYTPPLPYTFGVANNAAPVPPLYENAVGLYNSEADWRYASVVYNPPIPVYYELYISDRPDDPAPQLAGTTNFGASGAPYASWEADPEWGKNMRLPPFDASDPAGLAKALVAGRRADGLSGGIINWDDIKYYGGKKLQPNLKYYFWIRTYIIEKSAGGGIPAVMNGNAAFSVMISAATPPWPQGTDDEYKRRAAPVDFNIARDDSGNPMVSGESAVFEWSPMEADVLYEFVITSVKDVNGYFMPEGAGLLFGDPALAPGMDALYESFINEFSKDDGDGSDRRLQLDPKKAGLTESAGGTAGYAGAIRGFYLDPVSGKYRFTVDRWLFPNTLYYVSLRAVSRDPGVPQKPSFYTVLKNSSPFVTVPLTTLLLDAPAYLRAVIGAELGFSFKDASALTAAEYSIYVRGPGQASYALMGGSQGVLIKTGGITYGRIVNLEFNASYDIRVVAGQDQVTAYQVTGLTTRDPFHSVQVEWIGIAAEPDDAFLRFQVAIVSQTELENLPPEQVEYFELQDLNLEPAVWVADGREYPYEISENAQTVNDKDKMLYRATILSKPTRLRDGSAAQRPLEPNMRYYIKVRTRKISDGNADVSAYSRYAGPVSARTDFLQSARDDEEELRRIEDNLLEELAEYERETYYIADAGDNTQGKFLLKEDKIVGLIRTSSSSGYLIDLSENLKRARSDTVYVPGGILLAAREYKKTVTICFDGAEYVFSGNVIDLKYDEKYTGMAKMAGTGDFLVKLCESRSDFTGMDAPSGSEGITGIRKLEAAVIASRRSYANISGIIQEYIYDGRTGILNAKIDALSYAAEGYTQNSGAAGGAGYSIYDGDGSANGTQNKAASKIEANNAYVKELAADIKSQVSYKIGDILEGRNGFKALAAALLNVEKFNEPLIVTLSHAQFRNGKISPFISYDGREWFKLTQDLTQRPASITFRVSAPGNYSAVIAKFSAVGIAEGTDDETAAIKAASRYDLTDIFPGIEANFQPGLPVLNREAILLYERVLVLEGTTFGMSLQQKAETLGLRDIIKPGAVNSQMDRQRAAVFLARLYAGLNGLEKGAARAPVTARIPISDIDEIEASCAGSVEFCVGKGLLKLTGGNFEPDRPVTRIELIGGLAAML